MSCPSPETLIAFAESSEDAEVAAHVALCAACARALDAARDLLGLLAEARLPAVSERLARAVRELPGRLERPRPTLLGRLLERDPQAALAFRGPAASAARHRLYRAGAYDVDLALLDGGALVGHVLPDDDRAEALAGATCVLYSDEGTRSAPLDADGEFRIAALASLRFDLVVETPSATLVLAGLCFDE
jgi:hypothetical protein